jgi:SAM-dependent methyltransferase
MRTDSVQTSSAINSAVAARRLQLSEDDILRNARSRLGGNHKLAWRVVRQAMTEHYLQLRKSVNFRSDDNPRAVTAYCAMSEDEFEGINARQAWANWRTIPRNLNGRLPDRPVRVIDLCCGVGHSTEVLAFYIAPGSQLLGLEYNPRFVDVASKRIYRDRLGHVARVEFRAQSVLEVFRQASGQPVPSHQVDLVNSCGAVGNHFTPATTRRLAAEVARVLVPGGLALIDSGPDGTRPEELKRIFAEHGLKPVHQTRSCFADRFTQICFQSR